MANILVVEDERDIAELIADWLRRQHHCVDLVGSGENAIALLGSNLQQYAVLILDVMLPRLTGIELCDWFRTNNGTAPVLMLTAKDAIEDKEKAFALGADDYLTKPFQLRELTIRVEALLRRSSMQPSTSPLRIGDLVLDSESHILSRGQKQIHLSPTEFRLIELLVRNPKRTFSAEEILRRAWEPGSDAMNETVRGHINRLRRKLDIPGKPSVIRNVYGFGYKLELSE